MAGGYLAAIGLLGLAPALVFDPAAQGCLRCPTNLVLVHGDAGAYDSLLRWGLRIALVVVLGLALLAVHRAVRASARPITLPVVGPAAVYLGLVATGLRHSLTTGVLGNDVTAVRLWRIEAVVLVALAAGVVWGVVRASRARASVARLVVELAESSEPGRARDALARALGDPGLQLAYRPTGGGGWIDAHGRPVALEPGPRSAVTPLQRDGTPVAALVHDPALLDDPGLVEEVVAAAAARARERAPPGRGARAARRAARLARARIVEAATPSAAGSSATSTTAPSSGSSGSRSRCGSCAHASSSRDAASLERRLDGAEAELRAALAELRELAHGIFPAVLADEGLAAARRGARRGAPGRSTVASCPRSALDRAVEAAAYFVVAETLRPRAERRRRAVSAARRNGRARRRDRKRTPGLAEPLDRPRGPRRRARRDVRGRPRRRPRSRPRGDPVRVVVADDDDADARGHRAAAHRGRLRGRRQGRATPTSCCAASRLARPDVAIVDIKMPPTHTDEGLRRRASAIRESHPDVGVLVLSQYLESRYALRLLEHHPERVGYLLKERVSDIAVLADALRRIGEGECVIDPTIVARAASTATAAARSTS